MGHLLVLNSLALPFLAPFSGLAVVSPSSWMDIKNDEKVRPRLLFESLLACTGYKLFQIIYTLLYAVSTW